jgi:asparagine synthase (glutamine-hydrolysing)
MTTQATQRETGKRRRAARPEPASSEGPSTSSSGTAGSNGSATAPVQEGDAPQASGDIVGSLAAELRAALDRTLGRSPKVSLLFSGGLDSALLAHMLKDRAVGGSLDLELVTIGTAGASDLSAAERAAGLLGIPWKPNLVADADVRTALGEVRERGRPRDGPLPPESGLALEVQTGLLLGLQRASHPTVLCGQGADELFLGYAHFRPLAGARLEARYQQDLGRLLTDDLPWTLRMARSLGVELGTPYLDPGWRTRVEAIPLERRRVGGLPKALLREIAQKLGLPASLAAAPKKALQYGSGVHSVLSAR